MDYFWIGLAHTVDEADVLAAFKRWFPSATVARLGDPGRAADVTVDTETGFPMRSFPFVVHVYAFPNCTNEICVGLALSRMRGVEFATRTICDGSGLGDDDSPYWCVVWEDGKYWLADDSQLRLEVA